MIWKYPDEVHEFVKEWCPKMRDPELAMKCNEELGTDFTPAKMKAFRGNHGYRNGKKQISKEEYWKYQTRYPKGMYEFIRDNSWNVSSEKMAEMVNELFGTSFTKTGMKQFRRRHGIRSGCTGWYQKGHAPGNKGKKLEEYIKDPERLRKIREKIAGTQFKPGEKPYNELPVGSIVVNSYGYKLRKRSMTGTLWERWEYLHRAVWEEHNGPIPKGMIIIFKDGNKLNCDISNLMMISKGENLALCRKNLRSEDPELTETAVYAVRMQQAAVKRKRKVKHCKDS